MKCNGHGIGVNIVISIGRTHLLVDLKHLHGISRVLLIEFIVKLYDLCTRIRGTPSRDGHPNRGDIIDFWLKFNLYCTIPRDLLGIHNLSVRFVFNRKVNGVLIELIIPSDDP